MSLETMQLVKSEFLQNKNIQKLYDTFSFCDNCFSIIHAKIIIIENKVYLQKKCNFCNKEVVTLQENDVNFFKDIYGYYNEFYKNFLSFIIMPFDKIKYNKNFSSISVIVTDRCNLNCPICFRLKQNKNKDLSTSVIEDLLSHIENKWITVTGGEPTIREDLPLITSLIVKSNNMPMLQTNGIKLSDFNYAKKLKKAGLKYVHLSFNGFDNKIYEEAYGNKNILEKKLQALMNMKKLGFKVLLSMAITKDMKKEIAGTINFAIKNNDFIKGIFMRPIECGEVITNSNIENILTMSDVAKMIEAATERRIKLSDFIEYKRFRWNLYRLFLKIFGKNLARKIYPEVAVDVILIKNSQGSYELLFDNEELSKVNKKINELLYEKNKIKILIKSIPIFFKILLDKNKFEILFYLLKGKLELSKTASNLFNNSKIIRLWIDKVYTETNTDLKINIKTFTLSPLRPFLFTSFSTVT
jgi:molybdenum cofactor biosynthesis enzyme MoaA